MGYTDNLHTEQHHPHTERQQQAHVPMVRCVCWNKFLVVGVGRIGSVSYRRACHAMSYRAPIVHVLMIVIAVTCVIPIVNRSLIVWCNLVLMIAC